MRLTPSWLVAIEWSCLNTNIFLLVCKNLTHSRSQFTNPKSTQRDSLPSANSTHLTKKRTKTLEWQCEICCSSPSSYLQGDIHASFSIWNTTFPLLSNQVQNNKIILNILHPIHLGRTPTPGLPLFRGVLWIRCPRPLTPIISLCKELFGLRFESQ